MTLPPEWGHGWRHALLSFAVFLAVYVGIILVGSIWHFMLPPEWRHGWRFVLLYLAVLSGLILVIIIVGLAIMSWPKTEDEWGEWLFGLVKTVLFWGPVAVALYIAWHFIHKYW